MSEYSRARQRNGVFILYQGYLRVALRIADGARALAGETVYIKTTGITQNGTLGFSSEEPVDDTRYNYRLLTDSSGLTQSVSVEAPDPALSLNEYDRTIPYAAADVFVRVAGYYPVRVLHIPVFAGDRSELPISLIPLSNAYTGTEDGVIVYRIPPNALLSDTVRTPEFAEPVAEPLILRSVRIPETVTVHLGTPDENASNVYVSFPDYIKNVASSEIYPTWSDQALRANILAIVSLTLNRIFTEWYPSRGYAFDITNSTQFDQSYVPGRNIFDSIGRLVDELFNVYIRRTGFTEPLFASYCDGRRTSCEGLSQWGSEAMGAQGASALSILRAYYGNDIELSSTSEIADLTGSYPGSPLSLGSEGSDVESIRRKLYRIAESYPLIPRINPVYRIFDQSLDSAVRVFQEIFSLTVDGIVGKATWYRISYVYASILRLAELDSLGETGELPLEVPVVVLRRGDRGRDVARLQFYLAYIGLFYPGIASPALDGIFGEGTENALFAFQRLFGLAETGETSPEDWQKLYEVYNSILETVTPALGTQGFPGTPLRRGTQSEDVRLMQEYLTRISLDHPEIPSVRADGVFGAETEAAVRAFQERFFLPVTGVIDIRTWEQIVAEYNFLESLS